MEIRVQLDELKRKSALKSDADELKNDTSGLKRDIVSLKNDIKGLMKVTNESKARIDAHKELIEELQSTCIMYLLVLDSALQRYASNRNFVSVETFEYIFLHSFFCFDYIFFFLRYRYFMAFFNDLIFRLPKYDHTILIATLVQNLKNF